MTKEESKIPKEDLEFTVDELNKELLDNAEGDDSISKESGAVMVEELKAASEEIDVDDVFTQRTADVLRALGVETKFGVKEEKKVSVKTKAKVKTKTVGKRKEKRVPVSKQKKAVTKKVPAEKAVSSDKKGEGWREGSSADVIHQAVIKSGSNGISQEGVCKKVDGKFDTANLEARVIAVLRAGVSRDLMKVSDKGKYTAK